ncbi:tail fiber domain-containing protein [Pseudoalteromonas piratica]|uniref:tail fiber domain-containing protein n=1 Tax=Pseudoalteromonas piratica TaxID=1348114 RepID=UPI00068E292A|nr:tail fiber domain-containing protein [Pseudoalteromonas piratica]
MTNNKVFKMSALFIALAASINAQADQQILDDLIVDGSICVGQDCVNGESFGFDTLRLKENNLRIRAVDTSNSASFPTRDWQITFNDSSNGGANKFSIDDIDGGRTPFTLEAGAPSNSLYVEDGGRIGFGTSTPAVNLHVVEGNTPTLRLEQDGSSGFTAQTWDVAGNETNFFIRDTTNSSRLPFKIRPSAPTNSLYIDTDGDIGVGTASPSAALDIANGDLEIANGRISVDGSTASFKFGTRTGTGDDFYLYNNDGTALSFWNTTNKHVVNIGSDGNLGLGGTTSTAPTHPIQHANGAYLSSGGVWTNASSRSLKQNIASLSYSQALEALKALSPVTYEYKVNPSESYVGFIAEDVPNLVAMNDKKSLASMDIVAVLTTIIKHQQQSIDELKKVINK